MRSFACTIDRMYSGMISGEIRLCKKKRPAPRASHSGKINAHSGAQSRSDDQRRQLSGVTSRADGVSTTASVHAAQAFDLLLL